MTTKTLDQREALGKRIMEGLYEAGMIRTWHKDKPEGWIMDSGLWSPFYINFNLLSSHPGLYTLVGEAMSLMMDDIGFRPNSKDKVVGIAMAGIPLANAITLQTMIPSLYTRKLPEEVKTEKNIEKYLGAHGQKALMEGDLKPGDRLALVDDLVTRFTSKELAIGQVLQEAKRVNVTDITLEHIVVLLDREQGGAEAAAKQGYKLSSFIPFATKGMHWLQDSLGSRVHFVISDYLKNTNKYQDPELQGILASIARGE